MGYSNTVQDEINIRMHDQAVNNIKKHGPIPAELLFVVLETFSFTPPTRPEFDLIVAGLVANGNIDNCKGMLSWIGA